MILCVVALAAGAQQAPQYLRPPRAVQEVLDIPPTPDLVVSPAGDFAILADWSRYPSIAELSRPMYRLAGARINPANSGQHTSRKHTSFTLKKIADGSERKVPVPGDANMSLPVFSPDGKYFLFASTRETSIELWIGETAAGGARRVEGIALNTTMGIPCQWMSDAKTTLCRTVPAGRGEPPRRAARPAGPHIDESYGRPVPAPTFQDLLQDTHDEALFDYYFTSQLVLTDVATGKSAPLGPPRIFGRVQPSPDGKHILAVWIHRPYSYLLTAGGFPAEAEVWDISGNLVHKLASLPLQEGVPQGGVPTGPRDHQWHPTQPATIWWVEALDEGNPRNKAPHRDRVMMLRAPFKEEPREFLKTEQRFQALLFGEAGLTLYREFDRDRQRTRTWFKMPFVPEPKLGWDINVRERYKNPGTPVMRTLRNGHRVMRQEGGEFIFLAGAGATPEGDRPFLASFDTNTMTSQEIFRSDAASYESYEAMLPPAPRPEGRRAPMPVRFITRHESSTEAPNYFVRTALSSEKQALTKFSDPAPQLRAIKKQLVKYKRPDGVDLSFTLYLPPDYKPGERRPAMVWAYPLEYTDADLASQVSGSPNRFFLPSGPSHLFYLLAGYVVLDDATMPVVGDPETMNNNYVKDITASAQAAIDKAAEMGVLDPSRVGVGGHSYGAFMTANLLAHTDLFRAGVARSGAYNRTLTPFGFQSERRTYWQARDMYINISPFTHADKIKEPILLIHGEADNNSGTFPIQSERMFRAIKGNGGNVRYVTLPSEAHGYAARESVEHTLWEMITWFEKHVKNAGQRQTAAAAARE
jgi:dipeptidyl aminopeptidase/acylaminoacyl peptidase